MKSNFKHTPTNNQTEKKDEPIDESNMSPAEFEEFVTKSGAAGSFMIFRSVKKDEELGIDEL
jgi:hypothetical protein